MIVATIPGVALDGLGFWKELIDPLLRVTASVQDRRAMTEQRRATENALKAAKWQAMTEQERQAASERQTMILVAAGVIALLALRKRQ